MIYLLYRAKSLKKEKNMKRFLTLTLCLLLCATFFAGCAATKEQRETQKTLKQAVQLLEDGKTQEAYDAFLTIKDHPEAAQYLSHFVFRYARKTTTDFAEDTETLYEYDAYGRIVKITHSVDNGVHPVSTNVTWYEYDEQNRVIKFGKGEGSAILYEYDENDNIIKVTEPSGKTAEFTYDEKGNVTHETYTSAYGEEYLYYSHEYNEHGDVVWTEKNDVFFAGKRTFTYAYEYDQNGNMIKLESGDVTDTWEYDALGREVRYKRQQGNEYYYIQTTKYDEHGNILERATEKPIFPSSATIERTMGTYEYDYNNYGVVLTEHYYKNSKLYRTTNYFDITLFYNPYGEPEIPDEYLGFGS